MNTEDDLISDEETRSLGASPWAIEAGLFVVVEGEILVTPKGLTLIRKLMQEAGELPRYH